MTTPILIFDGPDNVGKGTQIALLRKRFSKVPFAITNLDKPVGASLDDKVSYGIEAARNQLVTLFAGAEAGIPQIADRAHYTEFAYSSLRRQHTLDTILDLEEVGESMKNHVLGIIFIDTVDNIVVRDDGKSYYSPEDRDVIANLIEKFKEIAVASRFPVHVVNIEGKDIETVEQEVAEIITTAFPGL